MYILYNIDEKSGCQLSLIIHQTYSLDNVGNEILSIFYMSHCISLFLFGHQALKKMQFYKSDRVITEMGRFLVQKAFLLVTGERSGTIKLLLT